MLNDIVALGCVALDRDRRKRGRSGSASVLGNRFLLPLVIVALSAYYLVLALRWRSFVGLQLINDRVLVADHSSEKIKGMLQAELDTKVTATAPPKQAHWAALRPCMLVRLLQVGFLIHPTRRSELLCIANFLLAYALIDCLFKRHPSFMWYLVVDDFSPVRLGGILAAKHNDRRIGLIRMSEEVGRRIIPIDVDLAFVWNRKQAEEYSERAAYAVHISRSVRAMRASINATGVDGELICGVLLNAFPIWEKVNELCQDIENILRPAKILVRLHPRMSEHELIGLRGVEVTDAGVGLEEFARNVDVVFAGNTSAIPFCLGEGTPVVYCNGLDSAGQDAYRFAADGLVYEGWPQVDLLAKVEAFYSVPCWTDLMRSRMERPVNSLELSGAIKLVLGFHDDIESTRPL